MNNITLLEVLSTLLGVTIAIGGTIALVRTVIFFIND